MEQSNRELENASREICDQDIPLFRKSASLIADSALDDDKPLNALTGAILQDAAMTAKVLKIANSAFYNPGAEPLRTISRAVIVLGYRQIRTICLSVALVDGILRRSRRDRVAHEMAIAFHAATQAKALAIRAHDPAPEEVFIAALLHRIGQMAFWCFGGERAEKLHELLQQPGINPEKAEQEVLGFRLTELTGRLASEWNLGELLERTLSPEKATPQSQRVTAGYDLAVSSQLGLRTPEIKQVISRVAAEMKMSDQELKKLVDENAKEAAGIVRQLGAEVCLKYIPVPVSGESSQSLPTLRQVDGVAVSVPAEVSGAQDDKLPPPPPPPPEEIPVYFEPDADLQLAVLREASELLESGTNFNALLELLLEGIYRGVGMDRALFALLTPDRGRLISKFALGIKSEELAASFNIGIGSPQSNIFAHVVANTKSVWVNTASPAELLNLLTPSVQEVIGGKEFFVAPTVVNRRSIGLYFADRLPSKRPLDAKAFDGFKLFVREANLGLEFLANKKG